MSQAIYDTVSVKINADKYNFKANGQTLKFKGFMALYVESKDTEESSAKIKTRNGKVMSNVFENICQYIAK